MANCISHRSLWTWHSSWLAKLGLRPPNASLESFGTPVINYFAAPGGDLSEGVVAAVALPPDDTRLAGTLSRLHVAGARVGAGGEAVAGVAGVTALRPVVIGLAVAFPIGLIAVWIKPFASLAITWTTDGISPPTSGTRQVNLALTVLP